MPDLRFDSIHFSSEGFSYGFLRVFIDHGIYCPGYQFEPDLFLNRVAVVLFEQAMELRIPHTTSPRGS